MVRLPTFEQYLGLDDSALVLFTQSNPVKGLPCSIEALKALFAKAQFDGFELEIVSGWRSFDKQLQIFNDKFIGKRAVLNAEEKCISLEHLTCQQRVEAICLFSAIPGFSRHHFGSDFDIYAKNLLPPQHKLQLTQREYAQDQYFYPLGQWLESNLAHFGFFRPFDGQGIIASEPWHISFREDAELYIQSYDYQLALNYINNLNYPWTDAVSNFVKEHQKTILGQI